MASIIRDSFNNIDYSGENMKWQRDAIKERIKKDLNNDSELLDEIVSELRKEKIEKIRKKNDLTTL